MAEEKKNKGNKIGKIIIIVLLIVGAIWLWQRAGSGSVDISGKAIQIMESIDKNVKEMKDNTDDIKPIKEDVAAIKTDTNEMKGTVGEIKDDTGAIRKKVEECLNCGQKKTVEIASPAVISAPAVDLPAPVLPSCMSTCSTEGQTRCTPGCLTGDQRDVCVRSGNCLIWQRQGCVSGQYCDAGTCRDRAVITDKRCWNGDVWAYTNGIRQNLSEDCGDSHYSSGQIYRCSGDRREYQERVETRCVEPVTGQAQCKSEAYWMLAEYCANGCSNNRCKQEEKRCESESEHEKRCYSGDVYWYDSCGDRGDRYDSCGSDETCSDGRCVEEEHEEECSSGCCSGSCGDQTTTVIVVITTPPNPPVVPEAPQPVPPNPPSPPIVIGGCTQNCTPPQVEGSSATVPVSAPPPPPAPSAPVTTGSNTLWSPP